MFIIFSGFPNLFLINYYIVYILILSTNILFFILITIIIFVVFFFFVILFIIIHTWFSNRMSQIRHIDNAWIPNPWMFINMKIFTN